MNWRAESKDREAVEKTERSSDIMLVVESRSSWHLLDICDLIETSAFVQFLLVLILCTMKVERERVADTAAPKSNVSRDFKGHNYQGTRKLELDQVCQLTNLRYGDILE
jgi:hypothetical protein